MKQLLFLTLSTLCAACFAQLPDYVPSDGLVGWWPLSNSLSDFGPNGYDATSSEEEYSCIALDSACNLELNENSPDVFLPQSLEVNGTNGGITCAAWLRLDDMGSSNWKIAIDLTDGNGNNAWGDRFVLSVTRSEDSYFWSSGGHFDNNIYVDYGLGSAYPIEEFHWYHFVASWDFEGNVIHYVQGEPIDSIDVSAIGDFYLAGGNEGSRKIGARAHSNGSNVRWVGGIRDIGFWQRPLSCQEVTQLFNETAPISGCTDAEACNFNINANCDDGSCYSCNIPASHCGPGTIWDAELQMCIGDGSGDINLDGCVQLNDLLDILSAYGDCGAEESPWQCGNPLEYQGYDYETVQIGEQCWFAENVRYLPGVSPPSIGSEQDGLPHAYVYGWYSEDGDVDAAMSTPNYNSFGALYNFQAVTSWDLCPSGWHVPSATEFRTLDVTLGLPDEELNNIGWTGASAEIGTALKVESGWCCGGGGTNTSGFSAKGAGGRWGDGPAQFADIGLASRWWTSTGSGGNAWHHDVTSQNPGVYWKDDAPKSRGHSVRCVKDTDL